MLHQLLGWAHRGEVTPSAALEVFDMFKLLFFFLLQLELFFVGATICKMSHLMALKAHEMRELHFFLLLYLPIISFLASFLAFDFALVGTNATHVTETSLIFYYSFKVDF